MDSTNDDRPRGPYATEMTGPGAWPETPETAFTDRATLHGEKLTGLGNAVDGWKAHQAWTLNGSHVWRGTGANAAGARVDKHKSAVEGHQQQFRDAGAWCNEAAGHVGAVKETIRSRTRRRGLMARVAPAVLVLRVERVRWSISRRTSVSSALRPRAPHLAQVNLESSAVSDAAPSRHTRSPDPGIVL